MAHALLMDDLRVQKIVHRDGRVSFTIMEPGGLVHPLADSFLLLHAGSGSDRTYAYALVDHLRWLRHEGLDAGSVRFDDLERYMGAVGADVPAPWGAPWRVGKRPYGNSALRTAASCLKGFYVHHAGLGMNTELGRQLDLKRMPTRADRSRAFLGHTREAMAANPLAPRFQRRRHPKMLPEGAREAMLKEASSARDQLAVHWLSDGCLRVGELCGLHLVDLHLRPDAACGQCRWPHVHECHRDGLANEARAKTKHPWELGSDGVIRGGLVKRASPMMVHAYFDYMLDEYPRGASHGMLLVQQHGQGKGLPWAPEGARKMVSRAGERAGLGRIRPHAYRHSFTTAVLDASGGNLVIARDAGGWASVEVVEEIYAHVDIHDPAFDAALRTVWGTA
ncbi:tyrosine-type recombinase/integrase [Streptomyces sp. NPDC059819]|uniref:tyrosine-type recombinase/integrase n=1 Tax=Streptomyces sp. NPDC059819 TaxID=3346963 RepID=UPI003656119C